MRCFIGIPVPADPGQALRDRPWAEGARAVPAADLHLTLAFLGERSHGWARSIVAHLLMASRLTKVML